MKKLIKALICMTLCAAMLLLMVSCGSVKKEDVVGEWSAEDESSGGHSLTLQSDGKYIYVVVNIGGKSLICLGEYEIEGNKIRCFSKFDCDHNWEEGDEHWHVFTYKNGKLSIGTATLTKNNE